MSDHSKSENFLVHGTVTVVHGTVMVHETVKFVLVHWTEVVHRTVMVHETVEGGARDGHFLKGISLFLLGCKSSGVGAGGPLCGRAGPTSSNLLGSMGSGGGGQACDLSAFF